MGRRWRVRRGRARPPQGRSSSAALALALHPVFIGGAAPSRSAHRRARRADVGANVRGEPAVEAAEAPVERCRRRRGGAAQVSRTAPTRSRLRTISEAARRESECKLFGAARAEESREVAMPCLRHGPARRHRERCRVAHAGRADVARAKCRDPATPAAAAGACVSPGAQAARPHCWPPARSRLRSIGPGCRLRRRCAIRCAAASARYGRDPLAARRGRLPARPRSTHRGSEPSDPDERGQHRRQRPRPGAIPRPTGPSTRAGGQLSPRQRRVTFSGRRRVAAPRAARTASAG